MAPRARSLGHPWFVEPAEIQVHPVAGPDAVAPVSTPPAASPADRGQELIQLRIDSDEPLPPITHADGLAHASLGGRSATPAPPVSTTAERPVGSDAADAPAAANQGGEFWLQGDVVMCACPDCQAPMSVRLWLMAADCWQCGTSIELSEQAIREVEQLLEQRERQKQATRREAPSDRKAVPATRLPASAPRSPSTGHQERSPAPNRRGSPKAPQKRARAGGQVMVRSQSARRARAWWNEALQHMSAWLISLIFHLVLLTLLGLFGFPPDEGPYITLSARVEKEVQEGGDTVELEPTDESEFDLPLPEVDMADEDVRRAVVRADQDARELRLVDQLNPSLPDIQRVKTQISNLASPNRALAARDPRVRVEMVEQEGGTTLTEAAVARGLIWLARHQAGDGNWSLHDFHRDGNCRCGDRGSLRNSAAATSLALLPFLGAGQTHQTGIYRNEVARGLRWLLEHQKKNGDLRGDKGKLPGMYGHGQAAIVLCEAYLMTGDESLRAPAQRAIDFIVQAQYDDGGWRYYPYAETSGREQSDTSVVGWQLMALQSAVAAGLNVPAATLENANHFLDSVQSNNGATYAYQRRDDPTPTMTAEGLLCRVYLGWRRDDPGLRLGVRLLTEEFLPEGKQPNIYYWYYATQTVHHYGGPEWERWNLAMRDILVRSQEKRGHEAGSWEPDGPLTSPGGRLYMTALAICSLEVYYRHLPLFRQIELE